MEKIIKNADFKVEVIVVEMDPLFNERCERSLKNQTYDVEKITFIKPDDNVIETINESVCDYIYIVKNTDVLSDTALEKLVTSPEPDFSGSVCFYVTGSETAENDADIFSIYYHLMPVNSIKGMEYPLLTGMSSLSEQASFLLSAEEKAGASFSVEEGSAVYGKDEYRQVIDTEIAHMGLEYPGLLKNPYFQEVLIRNDKAEDTYVNTLASLNDIYREENVSISSMFKLYKKYFMPVCKSVADGKASEEEYECVKDAFSISEKKDEKPVLCFMTGINEETLRCMDILDYEDFSDCLKNRIVVKDQIIKETVREKTIVEKETVEVPVVTDNTISPREVIDSINPAEYTVEAYRSGKLGFKTIFSSIRAWFACKFRS